MTSNPGFAAAVGGIEHLASFIANGSLMSVLFGWTSMHDLCIQQTDTPPYSGPYLRLSPLLAGMVQFRYVDTAIVERQWVRVIPPAETTFRFLKFIDQLRWVVA